MLHVRPETDGKGKVLPHALILPNVFLAQLNEGGNAVGFDLILSVDADLFLHFKLYRKTVCVPARFTGNHFALHGLITRDQILDAPCQHMADMRLAVRSRRAVIEDIARISLMFCDGLLENIMILPELFNFSLAIHEIHRGIDLAVKRHSFSSLYGAFGVAKTSRILHTQSG